MRIELDEHAPEHSRSGSTSSSRKPTTELLRVREEDGVLRASLHDGSLRSLDTGKLHAEIAVLCRS
ncbi:MAG: hypothetical protein ACF8LL_03400, partial [Phycisphaerales bacterium]